MDNSVVDVLPAVHALTGCDTTSTVDTNVTTFKAAIKCYCICLENRKFLIK